MANTEKANGLMVSENTYIREIDGMTAVLFDRNFSGGHLSTSGKTTILASTGKGFSMGDVTIALNVYRRMPKAAGSKGKK